MAHCSGETCGETSVPCDALGSPAPCPWVQARLQEAGYTVWHELLNAGSTPPPSLPPLSLACPAGALLPQTRCRLYIVGLRSELQGWPGEAVTHGMAQALHT